MATEQKDGFHKRGKFWSYRMRVPDSVTGKTKEVRISGFLTKAEAQADRRVKELEAQEGRFVSVSKETVQTFFQQWLEVKEGSGEVKGTSTEVYATSLKRYIYPHLGTLALQDLSIEKLESFLIHLCQKGKQDGSGLSRATIKAITNVLSQGLDRAVKLRKIVSNPMKQVDKPKALPKIPDTYDAKEVKALLEVARSHRLFSFYHLSANTGARRGELNALRWSDFNAEKGFISISKTRGVTDKGIFEHDTTKTANGMRVVELDSVTVGVLLALRERQDFERSLFGEGWTDSGYIFTREDGEPIYPVSPTSAFRKLAKQAGLRPLKLHSLRHHHATELLRAGIPDFIVAKRLGDTVQTVMEFYAHPNTEDDQLSAKVYAERIANA